MSVELDGFSNREYSTDWVQAIQSLSPEEQSLVRQKLAIGLPLRAAMRRRAIVSPPLSKAELTEQIQPLLPPDIEQRHNKLREKLQAKILTAEKYQELLTLTDVVE